MACRRPTVRIIGLVLTAVTALAGAALPVSLDAAVGPDLNRAAGWGGRDSLGAVEPIFREGLRGPPAAPLSGQAQAFQTTLYTDTYNANFPFNARIFDLDKDGKRELIITGVLTDYSWIATPNTRCNCCNRWQLDSYSRDGTNLALEKTGELDYGYDTRLRTDVGTIGTQVKVAGVGNMYPCGSGEAHAGMAVFGDEPQVKHHDRGNRGGAEPCHVWMSYFATVAIAELDKDGTEEIIAGGSGDSSGGTNTYRQWLLTIRNTDGTRFDEKVYQHFDTGGRTTILTDLAVAHVDSDGTQEIVATGYSTGTGSNRTWLRIVTWDGKKTTVDTEYSGSFDIGSENYLARVAVGNADGEAHKEIVLAGYAKTGTNRDWHVRVLRWYGTDMHRKWQTTREASPTTARSRTWR